eukprot:TRINITY_DN7315_c0_g1_i1.p1 TRINITY_DN7315_c0_g1~~TRINITY_DN7315_c0_g1_i1.p1  ORF type:complete len:110 (-),score=6.47 TRINITY_DN7315_c0_g1_i1:44-373(-)
MRRVLYEDREVLDVCLINLDIGVVYTRLKRAVFEFPPLRVIPNCEYLGDWGSTRKNHAQLFTPIGDRGFDAPAMFPECPFWFQRPSGVNHLGDVIQTQIGVRGHQIVDD